MLLFDPRKGDVEDDSSSPKRRSLLAIAGSLFAEISTSCAQGSMSALPPKADIRERVLDVRFGPEADIEVGV